MRKCLAAGGGACVRSVSAAMKRFLVRGKGAKERFGVAASSLKELSSKAVKQLNVDPKVPVTLVLAEDGTIVEDKDYFLCLPENTEFVLLTGNQKWSPCQTDGGTMWIAQESEDLDDVDSSNERPQWKLLAAQLKQNLANIVLFSDSDFQALINVETEELCKEMAIPDRQAVMLQDTLQSLLDRREEERECKELLQLYLKAVNKEKANVDEADSKPQALEESSKKTQLPIHVLTVLREKTSPQLGLSNQQLEDVQKQTLDALCADLGWDTTRTQRLQHECADELMKRHEQVQYMNALSSASLQSKAKAEPKKRGCQEIPTDPPKLLCPVTAHCSSSP